jgi:polysaccharide export outer membrane protein
MAGDITIQGERKNVLVIRNENGKKKTYRINLQNGKDVLHSPAFYLQQNDVIYVEPNNFRARQTTVNGNNVRSTSFWISIASLASSLAVLIYNIVN